MIYFSGVESLVESAYLREEISDSIKESTIFVNPSSITYLTRKTVIVNNLSYPLSAISLLLSHNNTVVMRVALEDCPKGIIYNPYIIRPEWGLMWNGETLREVENIESISESCSYSSTSMTLYFPKINSTSIPLKDSRGNLTFLGWALHQTGQNIALDSAFLDLDLLKTKKIQL